MKTLLAAVGLLVPVMAAAHPLGNFTTNRYAALIVEPRVVRVVYSLDLAELPTYRELPQVDLNGDGTPDPAERDAYAAREASVIASNLDLTLDGTRLVLTPLVTALEISPGAGGLPTLRLDVTYEAALPRLAGDLVFADRNFAGRPGWQEVVAAPSDGVKLTGSSVPDRDVSRALRAYPEDMMQAPLRVSEAHMRLSAGGPATSSTPLPVGSRSGTERFGDRFTALLTDPAPLGAWTILTSLLIAAMLGAFHALTPGHGKTIVGAYLVGSQGTARHAIFLGLVVTLTHTIGVYLLGFGTLAASAWVVPERLYPWISVLSGLLVVAVGSSLVTSRWRGALAHAHHHHDHGHEHHHAHDHHHHDHDHHHHHHDDDHAHGHSHLPPPGTPVTVRSLLALGISGGLLPCPSALVVMLGAIAVHRIAFGLALIVAFSVGLAGVLTGIGLMLVYARGLFDHLPLNGRLTRYVPVASALVISFAGVAIVVEALWQMGVSFS